MAIEFTELARDLDLNETVLRAHEQVLAKIRLDPEAFAKKEFGCTPEQAAKAGAVLLRSSSEKAQKDIFNFFVKYASYCPTRAENDWKDEVRRAEREGVAPPLHPEEAHHPAYNVELRNEALGEWLWVATMYGFDSPLFTRIPEAECSLDIQKKKWQTGRWFRFAQRSWKSRVWDLVPTYPAAMLAMAGYKLASTWRCADDLTDEEWESFGWTITYIRNANRRIYSEVSNRYRDRGQEYDSKSREVKEEVSLLRDAAGIEGLQEYVAEFLGYCQYGGELPIIDIDASNAPKDATPEEKISIYGGQRREGVKYAVQISKIWSDMTKGSNLRWSVTGEKGGLHGRSMTLPPTIKGTDLLKSLKEEISARCEPEDVPVMSRATGLGRKGESVSLDINTYNFSAAGRAGMWRLPGCRKDDPGSLPQTPVAEFLDRYPELEPITPDKLGGDWSRLTGFQIQALEAVYQERTIKRQEDEINRGYATVGPDGFAHKPGQPVKVAEHLVGGTAVKVVTDLLVATSAKFESGNARHRLRRGVAGVMARHGYSSDSIELTILPVTDADTVHKIVKNIEKLRNSNMFAGANSIKEAFGDEDAAQAFLNELRDLLKADAEARRHEHLAAHTARINKQTEARKRAQDIAAWREQEEILAPQIAEYNRAHPEDALVRSVPGDPESRLVVLGELVFGLEDELKAKARDPIDDGVKKILEEIRKSVSKLEILETRVEEEPEEVAPPEKKPVLPPAPPPPAPKKVVLCEGCKDWFPATDGIHGGPVCLRTQVPLVRHTYEGSKSAKEKLKKEPRKETPLDFTRHRKGRATMWSDAQLVAEIKGAHDPNDGIDHAWRDGRCETRGWMFTKPDVPSRLFPNPMVRSAEVLREMDQRHTDPLIRKFALHILTAVVAENLVWAGAPLEVIKHLGNQAGLERLRMYATNFHAKIANWKREDDTWPAPTSWPRLCLSANGVAKTAWSQADLSRLLDALVDDMTDLGVPVMCRVLLLQNGGSWTNHERMAMQAVFESAQAEKDSLDKDELRSLKAFMASARCHSAYISRKCPDHGEISPVRITCKRELTCPHCRELRTNFFGTWAIGMNMWPKLMLTGTWTAPSGEIAIEKSTDEVITSKTGKKRKGKTKVLAVRPHERAMKGFTSSPSYKKLQKLQRIYGKNMSEPLERNRLGLRWFYDGGERVRYLIAADAEKHDDLRGRLQEVRYSLDLHGAFPQNETKIITREEAVEELLLSRWREISKFDAEVFRLSRDMRAAGVDPDTKEWTDEGVVASLAETNRKRFLDIPAMHVGLFKFNGNKWAERHDVQYKKEMPPHDEVRYVSDGLVPWFSSAEMYERIRAIKDHDVPESEKVPPHLCPVPIGKNHYHDTKERCRKPLDRMVRTVATGQVVCRLNAPDDRADPDTIWEELDRYKVRAGVPRGMAWFAARAKRRVA